MKKAAFLDRDGVINKKRDDYVKNASEFIVLEGAPEAIKLLNKNNFLVIIITNQSAINRGLLTHDDLAKIHDFMKNKLKEHGSYIDAIYYCPHRPDEDCQCRKPKTELIEKAIKDYAISTNLSWFIGDSDNDMLAAKKSGIRSIKMKENGNLLESVNTILDFE